MNFDWLKEGFGYAASLIILVSLLAWLLAR